MHHVVAADRGSSEVITRARRPCLGNQETQIAREVCLAEATWLLFPLGKNFPIPAIPNALFLILAKGCTHQGSIVAGKLALRLGQCGIRAIFLCERLGFTFRLNETGITLQSFLETGRKFSRKALPAEFHQAQKTVDVTIVSRFSEETSIPATDEHLAT